MAMIKSKLFALSLLSSMIMIGSVINARPLCPSSSLDARLKLDNDESLNCWDSLMRLQSCTGEIILFFLNGEMYLGSSCCQAIHTISQQCWPNMIDTLGFTTEEGDILEGYCDHETADDHTRSSSSSSSLYPPSVAAAKMKTLVP